MPVGGIHGGITADRAMRSGGGGGGLRGISRTRAGILDSEGNDLGFTGGKQGPGSANAAIGTYAQDRTSLNNAYGGPIDDTGWLGRLLGFRTYKNPISNQSAGWGVNIGGLLGTGIGLATGIPGLGMLGGLVGPTAGFGPEFGAWRNGTTGTGSPGVGLGRGYAPMGSGMRAAAAQPAVSASPASTGAPAGTPLSFGGMMQNPSANYGLLNGYSANTRFGQGTLGAVPWGR